MIPIIYKYKYKYLDNIDYHELSLNTSAIDIINIYISSMFHMLLIGNIYQVTPQL